MIGSLREADELRLSARLSPQHRPITSFRSAQWPLQVINLLVGEYGDVHFGHLSKSREHLFGPQLSTRASLHARCWSEVV
jgi:hypothetical protein